MEGLIIFIVMALLSYFFSGNKKEKSDRLPKETKNSSGRFIDTIKTQIEKIEDDTKPLSKRQEQAKKAAQQTKRHTEALETQENNSTTTLSTRAEQMRERALQKVEQNRHNLPSEPVLKSVVRNRSKQQQSLLRTQDDVRRALVLSEVLGLPKSKRK